MMKGAALIVVVLTVVPVLIPKESFAAGFVFPTRQLTSCNILMNPHFESRCNRRCYLNPSISSSSSSRSSLRRGQQLYSSSRDSDSTSSRSGTYSSDEGPTAAIPAVATSFDSIASRDISEIIDTLLKLPCNAEDNAAIDKDKSELSMNEAAPALLLENAHILVRGRLYEKIMQQKAAAAVSPQQQQKVETVDALMRGFITSERKNRARLKVNYLLAGAQTGKLEYAIGMLSDSEEVDDDLLACLDALIKKELMRAAGQQSLLHEQQSAADVAALEELLMGEKKDTAVAVLRLLQRRLRAEKEMSGRADVRLLAELLRENDPKERVSILQKRMRKVEEIEDFYNFLTAGIEHMTTNGLQGRPPPSTSYSSNSSGSNSGSSSGIRSNSGSSGGRSSSGSGNSYDSGGSSDSGSNDNSRSSSNVATAAAASLIVQLPAATLERMRDLQLEARQQLRQLRTGLRDSDSTYSTIDDDYVPSAN